VYAERFGGRAFATINAMGSLGTALASYTLSAQMAALLYQSHITDGGTVCIGSDCFLDTYIILACSCGAIVALGLLLTWRTRSLYATPRGRAAPYPVFIANYAHRSGRITHAVQRVLLPLCCGNRAGRAWLMSAEDADAEAARNEQRVLLLATPVSTRDTEAGDESDAESPLVIGASVPTAIVASGVPTGPKRQTSIISAAPASRTMSSVNGTTAAIALG
jgi:hypothetical protein